MFQKFVVALLVTQLCKQIGKLRLVGVYDGSRWKMHCVPREKSRFFFVFLAIFGVVTSDYRYMFYSVTFLSKFRCLTVCKFEALLM